jgi:membrane fusion protein, copper/silver efflux system
MNKLTLWVGAVCLAVGGGLGYLLSSEQGELPVADVSKEPEPLFYRNPMNPEITSPVPTMDSMGMDYIPVYAAQDTDKVVGTVRIDPVVQNNIGLRTALAERRSLSRTIRTTGRVDYNEENIIRLHPKVDGWIRQLRVDKTGQSVAEGEVLLDIYSPKLVSTQQEYLLALTALQALKDNPFDDIRQGATALVDSSRARLRLLDVTEHQITELEKTRSIKESLHIHAPAAGVIEQIGARQGQFVTPAMLLYQIIDLTSVWAYADIYDYELPWVAIGDPVEMTLKSLPGQVFGGKVAYIYPYADANTRTTRVRLVFDNAAGLLRPETLAEITVHAQNKEELLVVPAQAVVRSGEHEQIFVMKEDGVFEPRTVKLGVESDGVVAVSEGVEPGERVVVSAQFLIDSESKLREATARMTPVKAAAEDSADDAHREHKQ